MEPRVSLITLGVADIGRARAFCPSVRRCAAQRRGCAIRNAQMAAVAS